MAVKVITLPGGHRVTLGMYVKAWKSLKLMNPNADVGGWSWYPMKAREILRDYSRGVNDRVNINGGLVIRDLHPNRLSRLMKKHGVSANGNRNWGE